MNTVYVPERKSTLAFAFIPLAGVVLLGWNAVAAVWFIWLDMLFANVQVLLPGVVVVMRGFEPPAGEAHRGAYRFGASIGMTIGTIGLFAPSIALAIAALSLLGPGANDLPATLTGWDVLAMTAVELLMRGWRIRDAVRAVGTPAGTAAYKAGAPVAFANLIVRGLVLCFVAELAGLLGRYGLAAFLLVGGVLLYYVERRRDWLERLGIPVPTWGGQ